MAAKLYFFLNRDKSIYEISIKETLNEGKRIAKQFYYTGENIADYVKKMEPLMKKADTMIKKYDGQFKDIFSKNIETIRALDKINLGYID